LYIKQSGVQRRKKDGVNNMLGGCWALVSSEKKRKLLKILDHFALGPIQHTHH